MYLERVSERSNSKINSHWCTGKRIHDSWSVSWARSAGFHRSRLGHRPVALGDHFGGTEVDKLDDGAGTEEDVLWFHITMLDALDEVSLDSRNDRMTHL